MCRDMHNLVRRVVELTNVLLNPIITPRDASNEEIEHEDVDHQREQEEQLDRIPFEERILMALEGRNDGIKIEVPEYAYDRGTKGESRMHQVELSCHDLVGSCTER